MSAGDVRTAVNYEWFDAYAAAILENDEGRLPNRVQAAERAIEGRLVGIRNGASTTDREKLELTDARRYLQILTTMPLAV
jgi:hypothetical protein